MDNIESPQWWVDDLALVWDDPDEKDILVKAVDKRDDAWRQRIARLEQENERFRRVANAAYVISWIAGRPAAGERMPPFQASHFNVLATAIGRLAPDDIPPDVRDALIRDAGV